MEATTPQETPQQPATAKRSPLVDALLFPLRCIWAVLRPVLKVLWFIAKPIGRLWYWFMVTRRINAVKGAINGKIRLILFIRKLCTPAGCVCALLLLVVLLTAICIGLYYLLGYFGIWE